MYNRAESDFSKSLSGRLSKEHIMVTRIESHGTGNGIPDMFVCGRGLDCWIELKADLSLSITNKTIKVDWRPGQIPWMYEYFSKHITKCCLTLVKVSDGMFIIPMINTFKDHLVYNPQSVNNQDLSKIKLFRVLDAMSVYWFNRDQSAETTYLDMINGFVEDFYPGIDYDPECLWNPDMLDQKADIKVFNSCKLDMIMTLESTAINNRNK